MAQPTMNTESTLQAEVKTAATVAGEDLARGDFVSLLNETVEFPSFLWNCCDSTLPPTSWSA